MTVKELIKNIEAAPNFNYTDLAYKLSMQLNAVGKSWKWSINNPTGEERIIITKL